MKKNIKSKKDEQSILCESKKDRSPKIIEILGIYLNALPFFFVLIAALSVYLAPDYTKLFIEMGLFIFFLDMFFNPVIVLLFLRLPEKYQTKKNVIMILFGPIILLSFLLSSLIGK